MSIRARLGTKLIKTGRKVGRKDGRTELEVTLSDHSIDVRMVDVNSDRHAWDDTLYRYGNVFLSGYANPIKPTVRANTELEEPDTADMKEGDGVEDLAREDRHTQLISSGRYSEFMKQQLIESILNPDEQWKKILYVVVGVAFLQMATLMAALSAAGMF